jgi:hypothetical protein
MACAWHNDGHDLFDKSSLAKLASDEGRKLFTILAKPKSSREKGAAKGESDKIDALASVILKAWGAKVGPRTLERDLVSGSAAAGDYAKAKTSPPL